MVQPANKRLVTEAALTDPASPTRTALSAAFVPKWAAFTSYTAGTRVLSSAGDLVIAKVDHAGASTFDPNQWSFPLDALINAKHYGIVPGGTGIQAKLTALSLANPGSAIFLPEGTYDFDASIRLYGGLVGAGPKTIIRVPEMNYAAVYVNGTNGILLRDFTIQSTATIADDGTGGAGVSGASSHGIILDTVTGFQVENVHITGRVVMGIHIRNVHRGTVTNCRVYNTSYDGIHTTNGSTDVTIVANHVVDSGDDGLAVISYNTDAAQNERIVLTGNTVKNGRRARGITIEGGKACVVSSNVVQQTASRGILINSIGTSQTDTWATSDCLIQGNVIENAGLQGITVSGKTNGIAIRNNVIRSSAQDGIQLLVATGAVVEGNVIDDVLSGNGIIVPANTLNVRNILRGNTIRRPASRGIYNEGVSTTISQNVIEDPATVSATDAITCFNPSGLKVDGNVIIATDATRTASGIVFTGTSGALKNWCRNNAVAWASGSGAELFVAGTVTNLVRSNNSTSDTFVATTSGTPVDVQVFTASGTWAKPAFGTVTTVHAIGGGGGGGAGRQGAAGTVRAGGGGGGGGAKSFYEFKASDLTSTVTVSVGAGGAAGVAATTADANGGAGGSGVTTSFGGYLRAGGGGGGAGGTNASGTGGGGGSGLFAGTSGASASSTGGAGPSGFSASGAVGGGAGGGITTADAPSAGGTSFDPPDKVGTTSYAGGAVGAAGVTATGRTAGQAFPGGGGGGGGASTTAVGGAGGGGAVYGGGGGGGGASLNGNASGAGGAGAAGIVVVITV